jgi:DNA-binding CsgD family transcriptional regulator
LVERDRELAELDALIEAAVSGHGELVLLAGAPGIGKTRLLAEAAERASEAGLEVMAARGGVLEIDHPFGVARQLLDSVLPAGAQPLTSHRGMGALGDQAFAGFERIHRAVAMHAATRPLLLSIDDAQWADTLSLRLLQYLAVRLGRLPIAAVIAARPAETAGIRDAIAILVGEGRTRVLDLAPLSDAGVARLLAERVASDLSPEFVAACARATGGNPFLVTEAARMLETEGIAPVAANAPRVLALTPPAVGRAVLARLGRQPGDARLVAQSLAVLGGQAELPIVAALTGLATAAVADAADDLIAAHVLAPCRPLEFLHPLVRTAVYTDLPLQRRRGQHAAAARLLAEHGAAGDDVAAHLLLTDPGGDAWVSQRLVEAAEQALMRAAPDVAVTYLRRALAEPPGRDCLAVVLRVLGEAESRRGDDVAAVDVLERALALATDTAARTHAVRWLGHALRQLGRAADAEAAFQSVIEGMPDRDREWGLRLIAEQRLADFYSAATARERQAPRFMVARCPPGTPGERLALLSHALDECFTGTAAEAARLTELALGAGALLADQGPDAPMLHLALALLVYADHFEVAERACTDAWREAEGRGLLLAGTVIRGVRAGARLRRGMLAGAEADARAGLDARRYGLRLLPNPAAAFFAEVLLERGDTAAAARVLAEEQAGGAPPDVLTANLLQYARGRLRAATGDLAAALADYRECQRREAEWAVRTPAMTSAGAGAALTLAALGRHADARAEAAAALTAARSFGAAGALGAALTAAGAITADRDLLHEAVTTLEHSGARLAHIRALTALGDTLLIAGNAAEARNPLRAALRLARTCGATSLAAHAYQQLIITGGSERKILRTGRNTLTPAERHIAEMAAQGISNRQIAETAVLSVRTIESHLAHVYQKLNITSRRELADALRAPQPTSPPAARFP